MPATDQRSQAQETMPIAVTPVGSKSELKGFIKVPNSLYQDDPSAITRLYHERMSHFTDNPLFEHAKWQGWVAWRGREPVGRISAQVDQLHIERHKEQVGFFGSLEAEDDPEVFAPLLSTAEDWLKGNGMKRIVGPMNLNINQEVGLLVDGFDKPPAFMMGHALPYYGPRIEQQGYQKEVDMFAYHIRCDTAYPKSMQASLKRHRSQMNVRPLDVKNRDDDLRLMCRIFNEAWNENWGFVPFTDEEFLEIGRSMLMIIDPDWIQIAEFDGEPAAFAVALPNVNEVIQDLGGKLLPFGWLKLLWRLKVKYPTTARLPLMGVLTKHQNSVAGAAIVFQLISSLEKAMTRKQIKTLELSWILEHNERMRKIIETGVGEPYKTYRVYGKQL